MTKNIDFKAVDTRAELRSVYGFLEEGLSAIQGKGMSTDTCVGDVYHAILGGQLTCVLALKGTEAVGFYIAEVQALYNGDQTLYLAYVYVDHTQSDLTPDFTDQFDRHAQAMGCVSVTFKTSRKGWQRRLSPYGFENTAIELTKRIA